MEKSLNFRKIAVCGMGVMGAQIAAYCASVGYIVYAYDLASEKGDSQSIVKKAIKHLAKMKPAPLGDAEAVSRLIPKNYKENLQDLADCDLIIEAIAERMDLKEMLYRQITPHLNKDAVLVTNTSGLSINSLMEMLPKELHDRFCGVHFFNPPRYMHLAELIPSVKTSGRLMDRLEGWLTSYLGKGVIRAKDTPNFIANRIGVFSLLACLHHAEAMGLTPDEVDALTGPLLGRPKSATMRTLDVVGLDTMQHVIHTMETELKDDPWYSCFKMPDWIKKLMDQGHLGQKSGQGIYRKNARMIEVFDKTTNEYRPISASVSPEVMTIMQDKNPESRMQKLIQSDDRQARFLAACFRDLFHYCAYHLQAIADTCRDVDLAIRWGFGWQQGPFETWQYSGFGKITSWLQDEIKNHKSMASVELPAWLSSISAFYTEKGAFSPETADYLPRSELKVYQKQYFPAAVPASPAKEYTTLYENEGVKLWNLEDDIAVMSLKSKANTFNLAVLEGMHEAMDYAEKNCRGMIIYQQNENNFSSGANLKEVYGLIEQNKFTALNDMIAHFQQAALRLRYSQLPVVAALRGRAFGGGCEMMLHCDTVVAAFESYPGLVEAGVGLIPAGGGCKEMARRASQWSQHGSVMDYLEPYFTQIAMAKVASSATEAMSMGYLKASDTIMMHSGEVLFGAKSKLEQMLAANYMPMTPEKIKIAGIEGRATLQAGLVNWLEGGFISEHDYFLSLKLARTLCGGDLYKDTEVDEQWLLQLEREHFIELCSTEKTQQRIAYMLENGKPLRN